jgi:hypothetical protein
VAAAAAEHKAQIERCRDVLKDALEDNSDEPWKTTKAEAQKALDRVIESDPVAEAQTELDRVINSDFEAEAQRALDDAARVLQGAIRHWKAVEGGGADLKQLGEQVEQLEEASEEAAAALAEQRAAVERCQEELAVVEKFAAAAADPTVAEVAVAAAQTALDAAALALEETVQHLGSSDAADGIRWGEGEVDSEQLMERLGEQLEQLEEAASDATEGAAGLDREEARALLRGRGVEVGEAELTELLAKMDADHDGLISAEELWSSRDPGEAR